MKSKRVIKKTSDKNSNSEDKPEEVKNDKNVKKSKNPRKKLNSDSSAKLPKKPQSISKLTEIPNTNQIKSREQLIEELLLQKENKNDKKYFPEDASDSSSSNKKQKKVKEDEEDNDEDDEDGDDEWDEVKIDDIDETPGIVSRDTIEINIEGGKKKAQKKKGFDFGAYMIRTYKSFQKKLTIEIHKAHLVCWVYHGLYMNKLTTNKFINSIALSLCDQFLLEFKNEVMSLELATNLLTFLRGKFIKSTEKENNMEMGEAMTFNRASVLFSIQNLESKNDLELILIILAFLRTLNIRSRLCVSFDVAHLKEENNGKASGASKRSSKKNEKDLSTDDEEDDDGDSVEEEEIAVPVKKQPVGKRRNLKGKASENEEKIVNQNMKDDSVNRMKRKCREVKNYTEKELSENKDDDEDFKIEELRESSRKSKAKKESSASILKLKTGKSTLTKNNKVLSDDENLSILVTNESIKQAEYSNYWIEVYLDKEEKWISIDPLKLKFDCDFYFEKRLKKRILYVNSFILSKPIRCLPLYAYNL